MRIDDAEKWTRVAGAAGALGLIGAVLTGLRRGAQRPKGRMSAEAPAFVQGYYRGSLRFYLPSTVAGLGLMYLLWRPLRLALSTWQRLAALIAGALLYFSGLGLFLWGRRTMGEMYNVSSSFGAQLYADHRLVTAGPFSLVRHPIYLGGVLWELGALLIYRTWATALIAGLNIPILFVRARREEEALAAEFGEQWADYVRRVPAWVPRIGRCNGGTGVTFPYGRPSVVALRGGSGSQ